MENVVLTPVDFSGTTDAVVAEAIRQARALEAKLLLVHVGVAQPDYVGYEVGPVYVRQSVAEQLRTQHRRLQELEERVRAEGIDATSVLLSGAPDEKLTEQMQRVDPRMIVLGSHGHGALYHLLAGSVCQSVLRAAQCPVVIVPSKVVAKKPAEK